jgi:zinc protease
MRGWKTIAVGVVFVAGSAGAVMVRDFPNGLKWIHRPVKHNRIVAVQLFIPGGLLNEPAEEAGVTALTTAAMLKGTATRTALQLAQSMEGLGASFGVDAQPDCLSLGGQVTLDNWKGAFDLFEDILLNPAFPPAEVEKEREALLNALRTRHEQIFVVADERLRRELYGAHPYARAEEGEEGAVRALTRDDLVAWHDARFRPAGAVLVTAGPVPMSVLSRRVSQLAARWSAGRGGVPAGQPAPVLARSRTAVETPEFEQSYLMIGHPAPAVSDRRYPVMKLLNALLGGGMSSPLFREVREEGTLAYEVSSFYPSRRWGGSFVVYAGMDPKNLSLAEEKVRRVLRSFVDEPPAERDLLDAKNYIRGHYLMDHQTNARLAWYLGWWELLGLGHAYDRQYPQDVAGVSAEEIHALAREILAGPSVTVRVESRPPAR